MPLLGMLSSIAREFLSSIFTDYSVVPVYVLVILLVRTKYIKYIGFKPGASGDGSRLLRQIAEETVLFGLVAGFVLSVVLVSAGFSMNGESLKVLVIAILLLSLVNTRFICFSYAGGLIALIAAIFRLPGVDPSSVLLLVVLLHFLESGLVYFDRGKSVIPVFIRYEGSITGAYLTQKFWPVPIVFLTAAVSGRPSFSALALDCIIGVLVYSDIAVTSDPVRRNRQKALLTFGYSLVLLVFVLLSLKIEAFVYIGAVFAVGGHEAITIWGNAADKKGKPLFKAVDRGLKVFEVLPGSHAELMGMKRGEIILSINGNDIQTDRGIAEALKDFPTYVWITVLDAGGNEKTYEYKCFPNGFNDLGITSVPRDREVTYQVAYFDSLNIIKDLVARFRKG